MLEVRNVSKVFEKDGKDFVALQSVDLTIKDGEFMCLVGPSGCGKTTMLKLIDGLVPKTNGTIVLDGKEVHGIPSEMSFVFQDINLLPWRSVQRNVEIGLEVRGVPKAERERRARRALAMVGMEADYRSAPYQLSGGMQQRVGVARAIAVEPKVLLMDEPFGHLDAFTREILQIEILKLWMQLKTTVVFVTHDVDEAILLSQRIALFQAKPGRLVEVVDVDLPQPRWEYDVRAHPRAIELHNYIAGRLNAKEAD